MTSAGRFQADLWHVHVDDVVAVEQGIERANHDVWCPADEVQRRLRIDRSKFGYICRKLEGPDGVPVRIEKQTRCGNRVTCMHGDDVDRLEALLAWVRSERSPDGLIPLRLAAQRNGYAIHNLQKWCRDDAWCPVLGKRLKARCEPTIWANGGIGSGYWIDESDVEELRQARRAEGLRLMPDAVSHDEAVVLAAIDVVIGELGPRAKPEEVLRDNRVKGSDSENRRRLRLRESQGTYFGFQRTRSAESPVDGVPLPAFEVIVEAAYAIEARGEKASIRKVRDQLRATRGGAEIHLTP